MGEVEAVRSNIAALVRAGTLCTAEAVVNLHKTKSPEVKAAEAEQTRQVRALMAERDAVSEDVQLFRQHQKRGGAHDRGVARMAEINAEIQRLQTQGVAR